MVLIERSSSLSAHSETYSNYKGYSTVKFLIAISPIGAIIFVSKCWVAKCLTIKLLTACSGILNHLIHGGPVLPN